MKRFTMLVALFVACDRPVTEPDLESPLKSGLPVASTGTAPATVTHTLLTGGTDVVNEKVYSTAAIAPAPNALITVAVLGHRSSSPAPSVTLSGGGMTDWTEVTSITFDTGTEPLKRLTLFRAMSPEPGSGPLTITFSRTVSHCEWIVSQWAGVETSGVNGAGAIGQTGSSSGEAVNGLTVPLAALGNPNNVAYGVFGVRSRVLAITPGAGFTEISEQPSGESTPGDLQAEWATNVNLIAATWTNLNGAALGVEIKAAASTPASGVDPSLVDPLLSTVSATPDAIEAGNGASTITVTVKDANGNPISGATVVLDATGSGNTLTQPAGLTDATGAATGTLRSTVAELKMISVTANGTELTQTATLTVTPTGTVTPAATITHTLLTAGTDPVNEKVYTTAAIAPAPNTLITVAVLGHRSSSPPPNVTLSGGGMTAWTEVASVTFDTGTEPLKRLTVFRAMSPEPGSGPLTITFSQTASHCEWIVSQWAGVETSGVNGEGAIGQTGSSSGEAVSGLTVPLAAFGNPNNVAYGVFGVRSRVLAITPGAGFTEIGEQPSAETTPGDLQAEWATNLNIIAATWTDLDGAALGVEVKAASIAAAPVTRITCTLCVTGALELTFDVTDARSGSVLVKNGTSSLSADLATDPTAFVSPTADACVRFGGVGMLDTGELASYVIDACDNGPGAGFDMITFTLPDMGVTLSGTLTVGDVVIGGTP